jgi:ribosomal protein S18 acetylase RimI-like enzyme
MEQAVPMVEIRRAGPDDAPAISEVLREAFAEYVALYTSGGYAATTPSAERILARMSEGPTWIAVEGDRMVGTVSAVSYDTSVYVRGMAVLPAARGQRIGELLLRHVEEFAAAQGCTSLFLSTTPFLTRAIRLYERFGFAHSDGGPYDLFGTPLFMMVKQLRNPEDGKGSAD